MVGRGGFALEPGEDVYEVNLPEVSSSDLRERLINGKSIDGLIPATIQKYLINSKITANLPDF